MGGVFARPAPAVSPVGPRGRALNPPPPPGERGRGAPPQHQAGLLRTAIEVRGGVLDDVLQHRPDLDDVGVAGEPLGLGGGRGSPAAVVGGPVAVSFTQPATAATGLRWGLWVAATCKKR